MTRIFPDMRFVQAQAHNMNFHSTPNPKSNGKIFGKTFKNSLVFGHFWPILPIFWAKVNFLKKVGLCQFLEFTFSFHHAKKQKKLMSRNRWTENSNFITPSVYRGPICSIISSKLGGFSCTPNLISPLKTSYASCVLKSHSQVSAPPSTKHYLYRDIWETILIKKD